MTTRSGGGPAGRVPQAAGDQPVPARQGYSGTAPPNLRDCPRGSVHHGGYCAAAGEVARSRRLCRTPCAPGSSTVRARSGKGRCRLRDLQRLVPPQLAGGSSAAGAPASSCPPPAGRPGARCGRFPAPCLGHVQTRITWTRGIARKSSSCV